MAETGGHQQVIYIIFECLVAVISLSGNLLVIFAFVGRRKLRNVTTNYFVISLAVVDLLVGVVGIPCFLYSMITTLPNNFLACLAVNAWIMMLCTVSIFHLLAVSFDRYIVIVLSPDNGQFSGEKHHRLAMLLIGAAWVLGVLVGCLPLMGWNMGPGKGGGCKFAEIMDFTYLLFLYYCTIITPTVLIIFCYVSIIIKVSRPNAVSSSFSSSDPYVKRRKLKRQKKIIFSLLFVVVAFFVCWYPLYTMNAIVYYCTTCTIGRGYFLIAITLSHLSSAVNPFIYAYSMPGFKRAFSDILLCKFAQRYRKSGYHGQYRRRKDDYKLVVEDVILTSKFNRIRKFLCFS